MTRQEASCCDWQMAFGNSHPLHVEIGFKHGEYLIHLARNAPLCNFVGIELDRASRRTMMVEVAEERMDSGAKDQLFWIPLNFRLDIL